MTDNPDDPGDFCLWSPYFGPGDEEDLKAYEDFILSFSVAVAILKFILATGITIFLFVSCCRKTKLGKPNLFGLISIAVATFICAVSVFDIGKIDDELGLSNCSYNMAIIFSLENIIVLNLAAFTIHKVFLIVYDVEQFLQTGSLPEKRQLTSRKVILLSVWGISTTILLVYLIVDLVWIFDPPQPNTAQTFSLLSHLAESAVFFCCSAVIIYASKIIKRIRQM